MSERTIGTIGNYYGDLTVKEDGGRFFWSIENWSGHDWEEIPESLYRELMAYEDSRGGATTDRRDAGRHPARLR